MVVGQVNNRVAFIIQARMKSTRLPGKILLPLPLRGGKPLLSWIVDELKKSTLDYEIIIATSKNIENDVLESFCSSNRILCFRGDEEDVLSRYQGILSDHRYGSAVRLTADNPILDLSILHEAISFHNTQQNDYTCTEGLPLGMNFEIVRSSSLLSLKEKKLSQEDKEHVTLYIRNSSMYRKGIYNPMQEDYLKDLRLTIDYPSDYTLSSTILSNCEDIGNGLLLIKKMYKEYKWLFDSNNQNIQKRQYSTLSEEITAAQKMLKLFDMERAAQILKSDEI